MSSCPMDLHNITAQLQQSVRTRFIASFFMNSENSANRTNLSRTVVVTAFIGLAFTIFAAVAMFPSWIFVCLMWFSLALASLWATDQSSVYIPLSLRRLQVASVFTFPIVASMWKLHEMDLLGAERNHFGNRLQHAGWAFCMLLVWAPIISQYRSVLPRSARVVWLTAVVAIAGNLGELFEFVVNGYAQTNTKISQGLYVDTELDLLMNFVGSALAIVVVFALENRTDRYRGQHATASRAARTT
jgi:hypothetical protein